MTKKTLSLIKCVSSLSYSSGSFGGYGGQIQENRANNGELAGKFIPRRTSVRSIKNPLSYTIFTITFNIVKLTIGHKTQTKLIYTSFSVQVEKQTLEVDNEVKLEVVTKTSQEATQLRARLGVYLPQENKCLICSKCVFWDKEF